MSDQPYERPGSQQRVSGELVDDGPRGPLGLLRRANSPLDEMVELVPALTRLTAGAWIRSTVWGVEGGVKVGAQLTPPRKFIMHGIDRWIPLESSTFSPMESLAYGGLGNGWGLGCFVFSGPELEKAGLDHGKMKTAYEVISRRHA